MTPRPAPDLDLRRTQVMRVARDVAEADGWPAVTMRRLSTELGVTQPVLYSAFAGGRQELIDALALGGFAAIADALEAVDSEPLARMRAYLEFATTQPRIYEAMFSMPSGLYFGDETGLEPLRRAFTAIEVAFPPAGGPAASDSAGGDPAASDPTTAEVAWATLHGLATLQISGRLPEHGAEARLAQAFAMLTGAAQTDSR